MTRDELLEDSLSSAEALLHDVLRQMTRAALNRGIHTGTKRDMVEKLNSAAGYIAALPDRVREARNA